MHAALAPLGWDTGWSEAFAALAPAGAVPARVSVEHRGRYGLLGEQGEVLAWPPQGTLADRDDAEGALAQPRVGDWVVVPAAHPEPRILAVLPRRTALLRQVPRRRAAVQVVAANLDLVLVVTSANQDFNLRRVERFLAAVRASGADAAVVLSKVDLPGVDLPARVAELEGIAGDAPVVCVSAIADGGVRPLRGLLRAGRSLGLVGSSGVGKTSLVNALVEGAHLATRPVRATDDRGRHTTTRRQLVVLPDEGGVLLDTPGMRELQLWDGDGVAETFDDLERLALRCRWRGCTHGREDGCAIQAALSAEELDAGRLASWRKLLAEAEAAQRRHHRGPRRR